MLLPNVELNELMNTSGTMTRIRSPESREDEV